MNQFDYQPYYKRRLPHFQPIGSKLFITFRLAGSLPQAVVQQLQQEKIQMQKTLAKMANPESRNKLADEFERQWFLKYDSWLDHAETGPRWLADPRIAELVSESIKFRDGKVFDLDAFSLMPNHGHLVCEPLANPAPTGNPGGIVDVVPYSMAKIMHSLKLYTGTQANIILERTGNQFWQHENYDHAIRDETEYAQVIHYVLRNPEKAGLIDSWEKWPWSYFRP
jgi:REP element-mobilizing transposase RayT